MDSALDSIPWSELNDAYGSAEDAPKWIRDLQSDDEKTQFEAINEFLYSRVYHQYDVYSVTPFVIPFVAALLNDRDFSSLPNGMGSKVARDLINFIRICAESDSQMVGQPHPLGRSIREVISDCLSIYRQILDSTLDAKIRTDAAYLIQYSTAENLPGADQS